VHVLPEEVLESVDTACPATGAGGSGAVEGGSRHGGVGASAAHVVEPDGCGTPIHAGQNPPGPLCAAGAETRFECECSADPRAVALKQQP